MDFQKADPEWNVVLLRYFNPVGAHPNGRIGENPNGIPNNLMPYITQVAVGKRKELGVFGNDYPTHDGTGVRDYIHVCDLANAHVCALQAISRNCGIGIYNVGTGHGYSVLDMVNAFIKVNGVDVPYSIKRRAGDIATCYCNPAKAKSELGWEARYGIKEMVRDSWNRQRQIPGGYSLQCFTYLVNVFLPEQFYVIQRLSKYRLFPTDIFSKELYIWMGNIFCIVVSSILHLFPTSDAIVQLGGGRC